MSRGLSNVRASLLRTCLAALWLASGCTIQLPEGKLRCSVDSDCPVGFRCEPPASSVGRCMRKRDSSPISDAATAGENKLTPEAGAPTESGTRPEAGTAPEAGKPSPPMDASMDAAMRDAARDAGSHKSVDASVHDAAFDAAKPDASAAADAAAAACRPTPPDDAQGVFVSPVQASELNNCGSRAQPCATIALGVAQAARFARPNVYVDSGEYAEDTLRLVAGVTVIGGWDNIGGMWTRSCREDRGGSVILRSTAATAVTATYDGEATLEALTIRTRTAAANSGESLYGIMVRGATTQLRLREVAVIAADAGAGAPGTDGDSPAAASGTCTPDTGASGASAAVNGVAAGSGTFTEAGYTPARATAGAAGQLGSHGTAASNSCVDCRQALNRAYPQLASCSNTVCFEQYIPAMSCPASLGAAGCGGAAGGGGAPGGSGGSTVALYVWNAKVDLHQVHLEAGRGGAGAPGGHGGTGAAGSEGSVGTDGPACSSVLRVPGGALTSGPSIRGAVASPGGRGGRGGDGSAAGGGAGGSSFAIVRGANALITGLESSVLEHGEYGTSEGGGATGQAANVLQL